MTKEQILLELKKIGVEKIELLKRKDNDTKCYILLVNNHKLIRVYHNGLTINTLKWMLETGEYIIV